MIPAEEATRAQLHAGTSGDGRASYLRSRVERRPASRYVYPVVSSWQYGWTLHHDDDALQLLQPGGSSRQQRGPRHGRSRVVADTFYSRNGLPHLHQSTR